MEMTNPEEIKKAQDITESVHVPMTDSDLDNSEIYLNAYNVRNDSITDEQDATIYNPKKYPHKAIDILINHPVGAKVEIYLDTETKEWNSLIDDKFRLSPDQMQQFFSSGFYGRLFNKLKNDWPTTDPLYSKLLNAIVHKKVNFDPQCEVTTEDAQFRKDNIDKNKSREKNAAGTQIRTNSGRIIVTFSDFGVTKKDQAKYYCWPKHGSEFKWSQWNLYDKVMDDSKSNPMFIRMSFWHNEYEYGLNLGLRKEIDDNRGFFGYNLTLEPKIQWTTPIETNQMLELSIVNKFLKECKNRIEKYLNVPTKEIYEKIGKPDKITEDQIDNTKKLIRRNLELVRRPQADKFIYD